MLARLMPERENRHRFCLNSARWTAVSCRKMRRRRVCWLRPTAKIPAIGFAMGPDDFRRRKLIRPQTLYVCGADAGLEIAAINISGLRDTPYDDYVANTENEKSSGRFFVPEKNSIASLFLCFNTGKTAVINHPSVPTERGLRLQNTLSIT